MTWTRTELKEQAKEALSRNYWKIVLVSFLMIVFCGTYASAGGGSKHNNVSAAQNARTVIERENPSGPEQIPKHSIVVPEKARMVSIAIFFLFASLLFILMYIINVLLFFPFQVGASRFMLKSIDDVAAVKEIAYAFDHSYKNVVKAMFHYDVRILLWSLLFIIPGIYKHYQYRLVPYILAEHPEMHYKDVLKKSAALMDGEKWKTFLLDLSFILWHIFGLITCGILEIFFVAPYYELTAAALYRRLREKDAPKSAESVEHDGL